MTDKGMTEAEKRLQKMGLMRGGWQEKSVVERLNILKKPEKKPSKRRK